MRPHPFLATALACSLASLSFSVISADGPLATEKEAGASTSHSEQFSIDSKSSSQNSSTQIINLLPKDETQPQKKLDPRDPKNQMPANPTPPIIWCGTGCMPKPGIQNDDANKSTQPGKGQATKVDQVLKRHKQQMSTQKGR